MDNGPASQPYSPIPVEQVEEPVSKPAVHSSYPTQEGTKKLPWEDYIPENGRFWVKKASTAKSKLFSAPDIQSIVKKAMVDRMKSKYKVSWFNEDGDDYPVRVFILKDQVTISLDTTGIPLHKRGYRKLVSEAPIL